MQLRFSVYTMTINLQEFGRDKGSSEGIRFRETTCYMMQRHRRCWVYIYDLRDWVFKHVYLYSHGEEMDGKKARQERWGGEANKM